MMCLYSLPAKFSINTRPNYFHLLTLPQVRRLQVRCSHSDRPKIFLEQFKHQREGQGSQTSHIRHRRLRPRRHEAALGHRLCGQDDQHLLVVLEHDHFEEREHHRPRGGGEQEQGEQHGRRCSSVHVLNSPLEWRGYLSMNN